MANIAQHRGADGLARDGHARYHLSMVLVGRLDDDGKIGRRESAVRMELTSKRLRLRPWRADEHATFATLNAEPEMARYLSAFSREKSDAMLDRIVAHFAQHGWGYWALVERQGGSVVGLCGMMHVPFEAFFTPAVEISWRLSLKFQDQGLAKEAAQAVLDFAFQAINLDRLVAFTVTGNAPSWGLMERLGMRKIGAFDNAEFPDGHALRCNVVYEIRANEWCARHSTCRDGC